MVWSTPLPAYLHGNMPEGPERGLTDTLRNTARGQGESGAAGHARRRSLGAVPSSDQIGQSQEKWLNYSANSPQRRRSFSTEPGVFNDNPFDVYKQPSQPGADHSMYEARSICAVRENPQGMNVSSSTTGPVSPHILPTTTSDGSYIQLAQTHPPQSSGNPFYDYPVSPIRYNKPIPKVELSPTSSQHAKVAFSDLDPFKKLDSPGAGPSLEQLKSQHSLPFTLNPTSPSQHNFTNGHQACQPFDFFSNPPPPAPPAYGAYGPPNSFSPPLQPTQAGLPTQQQHQHSGWPATSSQYPQAQFNTNFSDPFGFPTTAAHAASASSGLNPFGHHSVPVSSQMDPNGWPLPQPNRPLQPTSQTADLPGFRPTSPPKPSSEGGFPNELDGSMFDPIRQKNLADRSFDLGVGEFFPEHQQQHQIRQPNQQQQCGTGALTPSGILEYDLPEDDEDGPVDEAPDDDDSVGDGAEGFELQEDQFMEDTAGIDPTLLYTVSFTVATQFGMLLERKDEWTRGVVKRRERTVVTLVVEGGEAERVGVSLGSMIVAINGENVVDKTYKDVLELIRSPARPMRVTFEREPLKDEIIQGYFFVSKGPFFSSPTNMDKWKRKYVVLGGPIAKKNVLQIYDSKRAYHNTVVSLFQRKRPTHRVKTYALTYSFKCSDLQERKMEGHTAPLKFFTYMTPTARFKSIRIASEVRKNVQTLHERVRRYSGKR